MTYRYTIIDEQPHSKYLFEAPIDVRANNQTPQRLALICQTLNIGWYSDCLVITKFAPIPPRGVVIFLPDKKELPRNIYMDRGSIDRSYDRCLYKHNISEKYLNIDLSFWLTSQAIAKQIAHARARTQTQTHKSCTSLRFLPTIHQRFKRFSSVFDDNSICSFFERVRFACRFFIIIQCRYVHWLLLLSLSASISRK